MHILENSDLIIESKNSGAELTRIYSKKYNKEILWNGDPSFWGRYSPILFPIVGRLKDNETYIENKLYNMSQHGFARDMEFEVIDETDSFITYKLQSNEESKKLYPYAFELLIKYTLEKGKLNIKWEVKNIDSREIYFSIGAHPAFNISSREELSNYYIEFKCKDNVNQISLEGPYYNEIKSISNLETLELNPKSFEKDAIIFTNIDELSIKNKKEDNYIKVSFEAFPLVGIWSPYYKDENLTAPFICIEPWYGLADSVNSDKIYKNKKFINKLNVGETFTTDYAIEIK
ncbi:aldose 1-epimerase family protein [Terrisporobacter sp.]|uniref:aldose 1-epimerase family protein n=1 Tax=Terrisporobacter sp. TaxID=1965305 RepID=UPI00260FD20E|nr:aldose 1-epimerase family protein [Terrisporobacter sp.]